MRWSSICRRWNTLFLEDQRFSEKHLRNSPKQPLVLMLTERRLVWQTRWIKQNNGKNDRSRCCLGDSMFTLGYGNNQSCRSYKILMLYHTIYEYDYHHIQDEDFEIYDFNSNTWRFLDARINGRKSISDESHGVTLKGNAYWISSDDEEGGCDLLSFDFTKERFRRLCFPLMTSGHCIMYRVLSVVREELSVLCCIDSSKMEMWVTNNMDSTCEESVLSWSKSFTVDFCLNIYSSVLIDEDKKVALCGSPHQGVAFTIGEEDEYYSEIPFEGTRSRDEHIFNYVPSLVQFPQQRWWEHDNLSSQETDDEYMMSESDDELDWWEIEFTDFRSRRGSRGRVLRRKRCVTL
ncbi:hypothetical protein Bca101_056766 [Brassica carinata]